jgi:hypothetical protein
LTAAAEPAPVAGYVPATFAELRDFSSMSELRAYGRAARIGRPYDDIVPDARAAARRAGFRIRLPAAGVDRGAVTPGFEVFGPSRQRFSLDAVKAGAPPSFVGSTLDIVLGATVVSVYQSSFRATAAYTAHPVLSVVPDFVPVVIAQMPVPSIRSTGVWAAALEARLLRTPNLPPRLASALRIIGNPWATPPLTLHALRPYVPPLIVDGVPALAAGDAGGAGSSVIWQRAGMMVAVSAPLPLEEVLVIANSVR